MSAATDLAATWAPPGCGRAGQRAPEGSPTCGGARASGSGSRRWQLRGHATGRSRQPGGGRAALPGSGSAKGGGRHAQTDCGLMLGLGGGLGRREGPAPGPRFRRASLMNAGLGCSRRSQAPLFDHLAALQGGVAASMALGVRSCSRLAVAALGRRPATSTAAHAAAADPSSVSVSRSRPMRPPRLLPAAAAGGARRRHRPCTGPPPSCTGSFTCQHHPCLHPLPSPCTVAGAAPAAVLRAHQPARRGRRRRAASAGRGGAARHQDAPPARGRPPGAVRRPRLGGAGRAGGRRQGRGGGAHPGAA